MTQIVALLDAKDDRKTVKSSKVRAKAQTEQEAALELCAAAMKGLVKRQTLADITQLEDATSRERSNQQNFPSKYVSFPSI